MEMEQRIQGHLVQVLTKEYAQAHASELIDLVNLIPEIPQYTEEDLLAESKGDREYLGKWEHSLVLVDSENRPIGLITAYERRTEHNDQYPINTIYIHELAVRHDLQGSGIGIGLLQTFLEHSREIGFKYLTGDVNFSVQTNSASWNRRVQRLYECFGFRKRTTKDYNNRVDNVYGLV